MGGIVCWPIQHTIPRFSWMTEVYMFKSLGGKLMISYVAITTITIIVFSSLTYWALTRAARQQEITYLSDSAQTVALQALPMMESAVSDRELEQLSQAASFFTNVRVRILDNQDRTLADSGFPFESKQVVLFGPAVSAGPYPAGSEPSDMVIGLTGVSGTRLPVPISPPSDTISSTLFVRRIDVPWGSGFMLQASGNPEGQVVISKAQATSPPLSHSEQIIYAQIGDPSNPVGTVQFITTNNPGTRATEPILRAFLLAGAGTILLAVLLGLLIGRQLSAPLAALSETAARMAAGDLSARAEISTNDEIGALAIRFNGMADQLQASFADLAAERDALRRFVEDASHELRTPITALKNFIDLLLGPCDWRHPGAAGVLTGKPGSDRTPADDYQRIAGSLAPGRRPGRAGDGRSGDQSFYGASCSTLSPGSARKEHRNIRQAPHRTTHHPFGPPPD